MSKPKFNSCPFCLNEDQMRFVFVIDEEKERAVRCCKCHATGPIKNCKAAALKAWNARRIAKEEEAK